MRKIALLILAVLIAIPAWADDIYIDGHLYSDVEVVQWTGMGAPSVSPAGGARIYHDSTSNTLKLSVNGGAYADIATGATGYTNLTSFVDQTNWRVFYSDGSGDVTELALGGSGTYLQSNGAAAAPTFETPAGAGDNVIINATAIDTTATFTDNTEIAFSVADGGAGGPDVVTADVVNNTLDFTEFAAGMTLDTGTTITLGASNLDIKVNSTGLFEVDGQGAYTGDLLHVHQHTGNPGAGNVMHVEGADPDQNPIFHVSSTDSDFTAELVTVLIDAVDNDDADWIPLRVQDDRDGTPDTIFEMDYLGTVTTGIWNAGAVTSSGTVEGATLTEGGNAVWNDSETDILDSGHYIAESIDNEHLADDAVDSAEINTNAVQLDALDVTDVSDDIAGDIAEGELADSIVISADIKDDTIDSADYAANSIDEEHINWTDMDLTDFVEQTTWVVLYTDGSGDVNELALGADGEVLTSTGAASAPAFEAGGGGGATAWDDVADPDNSGLVTITLDNAEKTLFTGDNDEAGSFWTLQNTDADHTGGNLYLLDLDYSADDGDVDADYIKCQDSGSVVWKVEQDGDTTIGDGSSGSVDFGTNTIDDDAAGNLLIGSINLPVQSAKLTGNFVTQDDATQGAAIDAGEGGWRLLFDDTTDEGAVWQFRMPNDYDSALVAKIQYSMTNEASDQVEWEVAIMAVSDGDSADIVTPSFDTQNMGIVTVPGTTGYPDEVSISFANDDSVAAGDLVWIQLSTDSDDATNDDADNDREVINVQLEYNRT